MLKVYKVLLVHKVLLVQMDKTVHKVPLVHKALLVLPVHKVLLVPLVRKALLAQEAVTTRILPPLTFQGTHYKLISKTETP